MIKYLFAFFLGLSCLHTFSETIDFREVLDEKKVEFLRINYRSTRSENLKTIYKRFTISEYKFNESDEMVLKTKNKNKHIEQWSEIKEEQLFKLYVDVDVLDLSKLISYDKNLKTKAHELVERIKKQRKATRKKFRAAAFYMASKGTFDQQNSYGSVDFEQNSSFSLGVSLSYYPENPKYSFSSSIYYSHLNAASSNLFTSDVDVDAEIGGNIYAEYKLTKPRMSLYIGFDYEKFNTFSIEGLSRSNQLKFDVNKVIYLTVGAGKSFKISKYKFFSKLSFSKSLSSSRTLGYTGSLSNEDFEGSKVLFYLFKSINRHFFVHTLFKYHWMEGASDLTVKRLGVGFGYIF